MEFGDEKVKNYFLFLDESKPFEALKYFCLAGFIIEENEYKKCLIPLVNSLKKDIFNDECVILHEIEIRQAKKAPYNILTDFEKKKDFWNKLKYIYSNTDLTALGVGINTSEYKKLYNVNYANSDYFVALQIVLENFIHFLDAHDGQGTIFIESRTPTDDDRLLSHYHTIVANGTLFFNKLIFQKRLLTFNFAIKQDNNIGLQIADFIPNPLNRACSYDFDINKQKQPNLYDIIEKKLYCNDCGLSKRFGLKIIT